MKFLLKKILKLNTNERPERFEGIVKKRYSVATKFALKKIVLDIGCGFGEGTKILAQKAKMVYGIDYCSSAIAYAKINSPPPNALFIKKDICKATFPLKKFDLIVAFELIEHLSEIKQKRFLKKISNWLKNNGIFLLSTPNKLVSSPKTQKPINPYHQKEFTPKEFKNLLCRYFKMVKIYGLDTKNKKFIEKRKELNKHLRRKIADFLSQYQITHKITPFIPQKIKNFLTMEKTLPKIRSTDFFLSSKQISKCENLFAICQNNKKVC